MTKASAEQIIGLDIIAAGLPQPELEYRFHETRRWRFDYAWPEMKVALELDGGNFSFGRHTRGKGYEADCRKMNTATAMGWRVLRVTTDMAAEAIEWLVPLLAG